jgi:hypothetical protein
MAKDGDIKTVAITSPATVRARRLRPRTWRLAAQAEARTYVLRPDKVRLHQYH